jgi:putative membrane protein
MTNEAKPERFDVEPTAESHFSWLRTRLSIERTALSWVRTAAALIGFGFTIVQFFQRMSVMPGVHPAAVPHAPRYLGLAMIGIGVLALIVALWQYRRTIRYLWRNFGMLAGLERKPDPTPVLTVTVGLILVGVFAFVAVLVRVP